MLLLTTTTSKLRLVTGSAGSVSVQVSAVDLDSGVASVPTLPNLASITTATTTDIVPSPAASTQRNVKDLSIRNIGIAQILTVVHTDGTVAVEKFRWSAGAGETCVFDQTGDWQVFDANGVLKTSTSAPGSLVRRTALLSGTSVILSASTRAVKAIMRAGGGGGGGATLVAASAGCAGGGAQGGYAERYVANVSGGATLAYTIGAGGTAGANTGGTGGTGGTTTITINAVTTTANGGLGGVGLVSVATAAATLGGAPPAVSVNADFNASGAPGEPGLQFSGLLGVAGRGGGDGAGNSRNTAGAGNNALANTAGGGGGGCVLNGSAAVVGGVGGSGYIILEEFS